MLKKFRLLTRPTLARRDAPCSKQGHSERRGEEVQTALCVCRSPIGWILANGTPTYSASNLRESHSVRWASERSENAAGGLFQHPAERSV